MQLGLRSERTGAPQNEASAKIYCCCQRGNRHRPEPNPDQSEKTLGQAGHEAMTMDAVAGPGACSARRRPTGGAVKLGGQGRRWTPTRPDGCRAGPSTGSLWADLMIDDAGDALAT